VEDSVLTETSLDNAPTMVELLQRRAQEQPHKIAYTFLPDGELPAATSLTFLEVDNRARAIAMWIKDRVPLGERVLLQYPSGLDFVASFFGCLYAGAVPVSAYPLDPLRLERTVARLEAIVQSAQPRLCLTTEDSLALLKTAMAGRMALKNTRWESSDAIPEEPGTGWSPVPPKGDALAFLQYTSGSVSAPRGVMITHDVLMANLRMIRSAYGLTRRCTFVAWLPMAHDWGLINCVMQPVYLGARSAIMPVEAFLKRPACWLHAISHFHDVISGGPNFAYDLCVNKIPAAGREQLRLSSWTRAGVSAEPVRRTTIDRFASTFAFVGFRKQAFYAAYGLAEATVLVSASKRNASPPILNVNRVALLQHRVEVEPVQSPTTQELVSCGQPLVGEKILIVDPVTRVKLAPERVGEIWIAGPNVGAGYWNNPKDTATTFAARLADTNEGPFLRTGDLGFMHDDDLFVTGRIKDLIIIRGQNLYPQDFEQSAGKSHEALKPGGTAAFAIDGPSEERLVIVQEMRAIDTQPNDVCDAIRRAIVAAHGIIPHGVVLVTAGSIPKTSSGKLQRRACREAYLTGQLAVVAESWLPGQRDGRPESTILRPRTSVEQQLTDILASILNVSRVGVNDRFVDFIDSVAATQFVGRVRDDFSLEISSTSLFREATTIADLAQAIDKATSKPLGMAL
jgi:acyl-CoA synthetase (AMP-forming)/AMP-acid ligase II/acyl carrier protein